VHVVVLVANVLYLIVKMKVSVYLHTKMCRGCGCCLCVYSLTQQHIEVNDQFHPVAAACQCPLYGSGGKEKLTHCQISEPVCTVCDQLLY
jgi:hypothetical protein